MSQVTNLICIICPKGCYLAVDEKLNVSGNQCMRGVSYAKSELTNPVRMLASTVMINSTIAKRLPIISDQEIKKEDMFKMMQLIHTIKVNAPIKMGQIIIENALGSNVNFIASKTIER